VTWSLLPYNCLERQIESPDIKWIIVNN